MKLFQAFDDAVVVFELVIAGTDLVATRAVVLLENLPALDLRQAVGRRIIEILGRGRLGDQTEDERHHCLASFGFLAQLGLLRFLAGARRYVTASELELRHTQPVVPGTHAVVIVTAWLEQLLVQKTFALVVLEEPQEVVLIGLLAAFDLDAVALVVG